MLTVSERIDLAAQAHAEGRIIQGAWRCGHGMVCALAAFGPDINSSADCPADLMPQWMAELVPTLDDGIAKTDVSWFAGELIQRARKWSVLDQAAWERIHVEFLVATIETALEPVTGYPDVEAACHQMIAALRSGDPEKIEAARAAAQAAPWPAAQAAPWPAASWPAASAAARAAWPPDRREAAYRTLAEKLFIAIDAEISK